MSRPYLENPERLVYLIEYVESRSYEAAAANLHCTPSAVAKALVALENELGIVLVEKNIRAVGPTKDAIELASMAKEMLDDMASFKQYARSLKSKREKLFIRFGIANTYCRISLPSKSDFDLFCQNFPQYELGTVVYQGETCIESLRDGVYDAAIVMGSFNDRAITSSVLSSFTPCVLMASTHPQFNRRDISLDELVDQRIAQLVAFHIGYEDVVLALSERGRSKAFDIVAPDVQSHLDYLKSGGCIFVSPGHQITSSEVELRTIPLKEEDRFQIPISFARRRGADVEGLDELEEYCIELAKTWQF